jgi:ribose transport system ATP-binding protein
MQELKREGKAIVMISEELQELIGVSDRIMVVRKGRLETSFERRANLSEEEIIHYMI